MPDVSESGSASQQVTVGIATMPAATAPPNVVSAAIAALRAPGLVVLTGPPGAGRTTTLRRIGEAFEGPIHHGGALAMLRSVPALALTRALRVRLPDQDQFLLAEAVRSRVGNGLLLLDDLQWADPLTLAVVAILATRCRIAVTLRLPNQLPISTLAARSGANATTLALPPLTPASAAALARAEAPQLNDAAIATIVSRAGGIPLVVKALARATTAPAEPGVETAIAQALADLTRPARTALAALGLLGRPADPALLGPGLTELTRAGLVETTAHLAAPTAPYLAEVAAGLLDPATRRGIHLRLAALVTPGEAPRHLAAGGDGRGASAAADTAANQPGTDPASRAGLLQLACQLPEITPEPAVRLAAARAALAAGRPAPCVRLLADRCEPEAAVLRAEAQLQLGATEAAVAAVATITDDHPDPAIVAERDRIRLLAAVAAGAAAAPLAEITTRHGTTPRSPGLRVAIAAASAASRTPGWEQALATAAAAAGTAGDVLAARWSAWVLVETLADDGRLAHAASTARQAAAICGKELAYSWQTRFLAAELWLDTLQGVTPDAVIRRAADLADHTLPPAASGYATAAIALAEADSGLLGSARARLAVPQPATPPGPAAALTWVARETAWLDGAQQSSLDQPANRPTLVDGLRRITACWLAHDSNLPAPSSPHPRDLPPIHQTLAAWQRPELFPQAAQAWQPLARREQVRCLLATGLTVADEKRAVPALLAAEQLAEETGLVVLLGRTRRALRGHSVRRDNRGRRAGTQLTDREREILHLVAEGEPTRRIAGRLGISRETVETHVRSGMRKLGARTRTEAAALILQAAEAETPR